MRGFSAKVILVLAGLLAVCGSIDFARAENYFCQQQFALCTSAPCIPQPGNSKVAMCMCAVEDGPIKAFSTVCPHLGCGVDFDEKTGKFACPCHTSAFDLDGRCLSGPSPRGLDELEAHVDGRDVLVRYQRFRVGTAKREPIG